jgi:magnesium-transporting ATPase (P-type)
MAIDPEQLLLRGSSLKNTGWIYGVAVYTGHDSKVMMNSINSKPKYSKIEISTNRYIIGGIFIQILVCLVSSIYTSFWDEYLNDFLYLDNTDGIKDKIK